MERESESYTRGTPARRAGSHSGEPQTREAINLRVLLELRRRLKSAAEKELAVGSDRFRNLRGELRRAEAELRLCVRILQAHASQLSSTVSRTEAAQEKASQTCARLTSLERENEDLGQQLAQAQHATGDLQISVHAERHARHGTLDSFVLATGALVNELTLAVRDQSAVSARTRDLIEESEILSARAQALRSCYQTVSMAMGDLAEGIAETLGGTAPVKEDTETPSRFDLIAAGNRQAE